MEKMRCFTIFKIKVCSPHPLTQQIHYTIEVYCLFIILKYLHHVTYVSLCKITKNIEIVLTLLGVKTIATNFNSKVNVIACFT